MLIFSPSDQNESKPSDKDSACASAAWWLPLQQHFLFSLDQLLSLPQSLTEDGPDGTAAAVYLGDVGSIPALCNESKTGPERTLHRQNEQEPQQKIKYILNIYEPSLHARRVQFWPRGKARLKPGLFIRGERSIWQQTDLADRFQRFNGTKCSVL